MERSKKKAFTLVECTIVFIIIGMIGAFGIPILVKNHRLKIKTVQFYESYRTLYEAANKAKLQSPTGNLRLRRSQKPHYTGCCDLFAEVISMVQEHVCDRDSNGIPVKENDPNCPVVTKFCYDSDGGLIESKYANMWGGKCVTCKLCDDGVVPVLCYDCQSPDSNGLCADGLGPSYCPNTEPTVTKEYYNGCIDLEYTGMYSAKVYPESTIGSLSSKYNDTLNFDDPIAVQPNFITLNGMRFYGLERYPASQVCPQWIEDKRRSAGGRGDMYADANTPPCRQYRSVYIDTDGIPKRPSNVSACAAACGGCAEDPNKNGEEEAAVCKACYDCLKGRYGIFKFRLYNDGKIEPMTNRDEENAYVMFKMTYMKNGKIVNVPGTFLTYSQARNYTVTGNDAKGFRFYDKSQKDSEGEPVPKWVEEDAPKGQPCYTTKFFQALDCQIIPITPEVQ